MLTPVITEKTLMLVQTLNEYTFKVPLRLTKTNVKFQVEELFNVKVLSVRSITKFGKTKRAGSKRKLVTLGNIKRVVVKLKKEDKIGLFEIKEQGKSK